MQNKYEEHFERVMGAQAPDLFSEIISKPVTKIEDEKELFSELEQVSRPLPFKWAAAAAAVFAVIVALSFALNPIKPYTTPKIVGNIIIDCNPSVNLSVTEDLKVESISGINDDGKEILKNLEAPDTIEEAVACVIDELKYEKYLTAENEYVLISYCYDKPEKEKDVEHLVKKGVPKDVKCEYQTFRKNKKLEKEASKEKVSVGKYKYIETISKSNKQEKKKLCKMTINEIKRKLKKEKKTKPEPATKPREDNVEATEQPTASEESTKAEKPKKTTNEKPQEEGVVEDYTEQQEKLKPTSETKPNNGENKGGDNQTKPKKEEPTETEEPVTEPPSEIQEKKEKPAHKEKPNTIRNNENKTMSEFEDNLMSE